LRMHSLWYRFCYQYYQEDLPILLDVHQKIFNHFRNQDVDQKVIGKLVQGHIQVAYRSFLAYLDEQDIGNRKTEDRSQMTGDRS
ncbi:MAG: hypothetical protein V3V39_03765, partial [Desulfobacterales bacterium]